ncbi:MAG: phosphotransferase family protein, partial [Vicinamibacterales bacterium]
MVDRASNPDIRAIHELAVQVLPGLEISAVERVDEGVSTFVYRVSYRRAVFYLRVLPEAGASFAPEVSIHRRLRDAGVKVPDVIHFEHLNQALQRSVMIISEIRGCQIGHHLGEQHRRDILIEAGRDLAMINSIPVDGFGWIRRDIGNTSDLVAEHPTFQPFAFEHLNDDLQLLGTSVFTVDEIATIRDTITRSAPMFSSDRGWLAHGDFDVTHIYQFNGRYSGIIDFGEIRGADSLYDLAHFKLHDGETIASQFLPDLLEGYRQVTPRSDDIEQRITPTCLLIGIRTLARHVRQRPRTDHLRAHVTAAVRECVEELSA